MKNKVFGLAVIAAIALTLTFTACDILGNDNDSTTFTSMSDFWDWYNEQPDNTPDEPYKAKLNIKDANAYVTGFNLGLMYFGNSKKYVYLDFSGSTFTSISKDAFEGRGNLVGIILPDTVTSIGEGAFEDCTNLTDVNIPNGITSIENSTFNRTKLTSITIPDSVTSIGNNAFARTGLTSITIPNGVTYLSGFNDCTGLTGITIPNSVTTIGSYAFSECTGLTGITIPNNVTTIGSYAFNGCTGITSVTIPSSVTSIEVAAFHINSLTSVTFEGNISSSNFKDENIFAGSASFPGNLRGRYYAPEPENKFVENGTPGTYTRPDTSSNTWTLQPQE